MAAPQSLLQVIWLHGFCARRLPYSLCCRSFGYMGSVHEGCPTVFAAGHLVTWVLCTKAAPQSLLQVIWLHGFCARRLPQSLLQVIWLHGFCARRLPHSLCCRSFGYMGSVHEGCPTVFAAGHLVTWVLCTKAAPQSLLQVVQAAVHLASSPPEFPQATADARGCRVEGMPAARLVLSCRCRSDPSSCFSFFAPAVPVGRGWPGPA